jgi:hypothetical protein
MSTISLCSNEPSNSSNSFSNLNNFQLTPLNVSGDGLQPFLGLIGQILLIKIKT